MIQRTFCLLATLAVCAWLVWTRLIWQPIDGVPVIVVDIDTLRADRLGAYGYERETSPHLDAFARDAAFFRWTFSQAPNTPPSQSSILTSLYPTTHGKFRNQAVLPAAATTLAEALSAAGYRTAAFADGGLMAGGFGFEQGFDTYDDEGGRLRVIGPKVVDWIDSTLRSGDRRPFFLFIHTYDVHTPYEVSPARFRDRFLESLERPDREFLAGVSAAMSEAERRNKAGQPSPLDALQLQWIEALYDGGIRHVDWWFGKFIGVLRQRQLLEQAIVVVISDHGDAFQEHGRLLHAVTYSPVTRIPFMLRAPGGRGAGVYDEVVQSIDLMPTVLDLLDLEIPHQAQGQSLRPLLEGGALPQQLAFTSDPHATRFTVTTTRHRLHWRPEGGSTELYAYRDDPLEQVPLDDPETEERLLAQVGQWLETTQSTQLQESAEVETIDDELTRQLRALGYLD